MSPLMWRKRMQADMVVAGLGERAQTAYLRAVRMLSQHYNGTDPTQLTAAKERRILNSIRHPSFYACLLTVVVSTLNYLSRYVSRTAITNDRIESMDDDHVAFRFRRRDEHKDRHMRLPAFVFLQHVLPRGLHRIRHHRLLSRRLMTALNVVRAAILKRLADVDPDLELEDRSVPILIRRPDAGPRCPVYDHPQSLEYFTRIRPPPWNTVAVCRSRQQFVLKTVRTEPDRGPRRLQNYAAISRRSSVLPPARPPHRATTKPVHRAGLLKQ